MMESYEENEIGKKMWKGEKEGRKRGRSGGGREWKETEGQEEVKRVG